MEESLIIRAFDQVTTLRRSQPGLIAHSDQGGQYFGKTFRDRLTRWECRQSMAEKESLSKCLRRVLMELPEGRVAGRWLLRELTRYS